MIEKLSLLKNARIISVFFSFFILLTTTAALAASVTLRWDPNDPAPEGYRVFARKSGQAYNYSQPAWEGDTASCTVDNLEDGADCYFVVRAYDNGLESADSNEVHTSTATPNGSQTTANTSTSTATPNGSQTTASTGTSTATPIVSQGPLALNRPAFASSVERAGREAARAVDDSSTTRWASAPSNDQWIYVDLGAVRTIDGVMLNWETAYGAQYEIQVSDNAVNWTTVYTEHSGNGGIDDIIFPATEARYVRMQGIQRGTGWGYSLFEFEVYGESSTTASTSTSTATPNGSQTTANTSTSTATPNGSQTTASTGTSTATPNGSQTTASTGTSTATPIVSQGPLALNRPAFASSVERAGREAARAVDDSSTTRWASAPSNDQWIYVDLGAVRTIDGVMLNWETAYGAQYEIQVSDNAVNWTTVYTEHSGNGGIDDIIFPATEARYVRMQGIQRGTGWGYSLFEFEVYGESSTAASTSTSTATPNGSQTTANTSTSTATPNGSQTTANTSTSTATPNGSQTTANTSTSTATPNGSQTTASTGTSTATPIVSQGPLALNRPAFASSVERAGREAARAVDDSSTTRWASAPSNDQWIYVDLGAVRTIDGVMLNWETAYGAQYEIQVSDNAVNWTTVYTEHSGNGGIDDIIFPATEARYVRMQGIQRGTGWGYSLFEFEVYGESSTTASTSTSTATPNGSQTTDTTPPSWNGATGGIGTAEDNGTSGSVTVEFDTASDVVDGANLIFNVYYAASGSWNNADWTSNSVVVDATVSAGNIFSHAATVSGLIDGVSYTFGVRVEDQSGNEDANTGTSTATPIVSQGPLALNRPAFASSVERAGREAARAVDDSSTTRWASAPSNDQWIYVDLGAVRTIDGVMLNWETAYGAQYEIQVSDNAVNWTTVYTEHSGNGGIDDIIFPATEARYVRMQGIQRGTGWGYSLFEFEVYGSR